MKTAILRHSWTRHWLCVFGLCLCAKCSSAAPIAELHLQEAIERTLAHNPGLMALGYQLQAQQARVTQAQVKPAAELDVQVENILGSGGFAGSDGAETTLSLGWVLEHGRREHYIEAARATVTTLEAEAQIGRLDAIARTVRLFLDTLEFQERRKLSQQAVTVAEQTVATVETRLHAGRAPGADLARAQAELARARLAVLDLDYERHRVRQQLATQWGQAQADFEQVSGHWQQLPAPASFTLLLAQLADAPELSIFHSQQRLGEAQLRLAQTQGRADWRINAGVRRLEQTGDSAFVAGLSMPLTSENDNRGRLAEARAELAQLEAERLAGRLDIEVQLFALYQALQHSLRRVITLRDEVLPQLQQAAAQTRQGYENGRYSFYELQQLQSELLATRMDLLRATIDAHRHQTEIERLTGAAMPSVELP
jgi:cobalt-zinc-cadmium efflux system outer membrane protein